MLKKISLVIVLSFMFVSSAHAMILFAPSVSYLDQQQTVDPATEVDAKLTMIDLRLGYVFDFGLYVGGLYSVQDHDILSDSSDSYMGPTLGYYNSGFFIAGTWYVYGEKDITSGSGKFSGISGYQLDIAYTLPLTDSIRLGPQLTYHSIEFDELEVDGFSNPARLEWTGITPFFSLMFVF